MLMVGVEIVVGQMVVGRWGVGEFIHEVMTSLWVLDEISRDVCDFRGI